MADAPKILIAIPCMDMVHSAFMESLLGMRREDCMIAIARSSLIYDARNLLAQKAVKEGYDRILWLDSDMMFHGDLFYKLSADLDEGYGFAYGDRPLTLGICSATGNGNNTVPVKTYSSGDYPKDTIFEIAACGFGGIMMETSIVSEMYKRFGAPFFPISGFGEDLSFCRRCSEMGVKMYCDSRIKLGHVAQYVVDEDMYLSGDRIRMWD